MPNIILSPHGSQIPTDNGQTVTERFVTVEDKTTPAGGTTGQVLKKASGADHDTTWADSNEINTATNQTKISVDDTSGATIRTNNATVGTINNSGQYVIGDGAAEASCQITTYPTTTFTKTQYSAGTVGASEKIYRAGGSVSVPTQTPTSTTLLNKQQWVHDGTGYQLGVNESFQTASTYSGSIPAVKYLMTSRNQSGTILGSIGVNENNSTCLGYNSLGVLPTSGEKVQVNGAITLKAATGTNTGTIEWNGSNFRGYNGSSWVNLDAGGAGSDLIYKTTIQQVVTSQTYTTITQLTTGSLGTGTYHFWFAAKTSSSTTTNGIGFRVGQGTATISEVFAQWHIPQAANGTDAIFVINQLSPTTDVTSGSMLASNTNYPVIGFGYFVVSVTGTVAVQMRAELSAQSVRMESGGMFLVKPI